MRRAFMILAATALGGCSNLHIKPSNHADVAVTPGPVETLGETIAKEQQGDGCLVAGNLGKGGHCEKLRKDLNPPRVPASKDD